MHRLRAGLHNEQLAGQAVFGPFHVHGCRTTVFGAVMVLNQTGPAGQRENVVIGQDVAGALGRGHRDIPGHLAAPDIVHEFIFLRPQPFLEDGTETLLQGGLEDGVFVGIHRALHDVFAEPIGRVDQHGVAEAGLGVDGKHHAGRGEIRPHHALHPNGQRNRAVVKALIGAIRDGAIREQRGKAALAGVEQRGMALDIQIGLLLPGKAGVWQILGRGAAADSDIHGVRVAVGT